MPFNERKEPATPMKPGLRGPSCTCPHEILVPASRTYTRKALSCMHVAAPNPNAAPSSSATLMLCALIFRQKPAQSIFRAHTAEARHNGRFAVPARSTRKAILCTSSTHTHTEHPAHRDSLS